MTAHARCVGPENTLVEAAGLMRQFDIGAVPVCEADRLTGMLTDRDIAVRAVADGRDPNSTTVRDVMSPGVIFVLAEQEVEEAVRVMEQRQVRRLPVLNRAKELVGIVSLGDIAVASNPAFSGLALREVSESEQTLSHRGAKAVAAENRRSRPSSVGPEVPGEARRAPRGESAARSAGRTAGRAKSSRQGSRARGSGKTKRARGGTKKSTRSARGTKSRARAA